MTHCNGDFNQSYNFHGGAVLADSTCGSLSLYSASGDVLNIHLDHDPEFTMSGLYEPTEASGDYCYN